MGEMHPTGYLRILWCSVIHYSLLSLWWLFCQYWWHEYFLLMAISLNVSFFKIIKFLSLVVCFCFILPSSHLLQRNWLQHYMRQYFMETLRTINKCLATANTLKKLKSSSVPRQVAPWNRREFCFLCNESFDSLNSDDFFFKYFVVRIDDNNLYNIPFLSKIEYFKTNISPSSKWLEEAI